MKRYEIDPVAMLEAATAALEVASLRAVALAGNVALTELQLKALDDINTRLHAVADGLFEIVEPSDASGDDPVDEDTATDDDEILPAEEPIDWSAIDEITEDTLTQIPETPATTPELHSIKEALPVDPEEVPDELMLATIQSCMDASDRRSMGIGFVAWKINPQGGLNPRDFSRLREHMNTFPGLRIVDSDTSRYTILGFRPKKVATHKTPATAAAPRDLSADIRGALGGSGGGGSAMKPRQRGRW